jgi:hypothetical protein
MTNSQARNKLRLSPRGEAQIAEIFQGITRIFCNASSE